ncbi:hypothetical protein K439DRAFT_1613262 [Ramaria rubella]|nr:hypothetical protein K439DRAFT_1613262 [Ramaria rubella]
MLTHFSSLLAVNTVLEGRHPVEATICGDDDRVIVISRVLLCEKPSSLNMPRSHTVTRIRKISLLSCQFNLTSEHVKQRMHDLRGLERVSSHMSAARNLRSSFNINENLRLICTLLLTSRLPTQPPVAIPRYNPQCILHLVSWGAIGTHVEKLSHRSIFQNATDAEVDIAVQACRAARSGHCFLSVGKEGLYGVSAIWHLLVLYLGQGTPYLPIVLQVHGGTSGPNYAVPHVHACGEKLANAGKLQKIVIDCSHSNSEREHKWVH